MRGVLVRERKGEEGECRTLENGVEDSMPGATKTAHCIFLRERDSGTQKQNEREREGAHEH